MSAESDASASSSANNQSLYLGLGVGVGGLLLIGILAVIIQIVRRSRQYRHVHSLEHGLPSTNTAQCEVVESTRPSDGGLLAINDHKWEALSSKEDINAPSVPSRKSMIPAFHLPKRMKRRGIALQRLKHLSAIAESPRSQHVPSVPTLDASHKQEVAANDETDAAWPLTSGIKDNAAGGLKIRSLEESFGQDRPRAPRSVSVSALLEPSRGLAGFTSSSAGVKTHVRSVSLGAEPPARLPPDPVQQIVIPPLGQDNTSELTRRLSRDSYSSEASAGSSVLINSPFMNRRKAPRFMNPPDDVRMQQSANRVVVIKESHHAQAHAVDQVASRVSLLSDEEKASRAFLLSSSSVSSLDDDSSSIVMQRNNSMSAFQFPIRSALESPRSAKSRRTQSSARRVSRGFSVSADGSPSGRKRSGVLQDICSNALPTRELSNASQRSTNSSDGNPFQWDGVPVKPSAMKGSPNARKGHRRQNCVRISTLTPQVLGPPPSRPDSPSITHGIQEETCDTSPSGLTFVTNRKPARPSSVGPSNSLRVKTLRASLTPSSPTLSLWATYSDSGLPSQPSDSHMTVSSAGRLSRTASGISSIYSIPQFPSPSTVTVSQVQHDRPVPEFCISSPADVDSSSSPFALQSECSPRAGRIWSDATRKRPREASPSENEVTTAGRVQWSSRPPSTVSLSSNDATRSGSDRPSSPGRNIYTGQRLSSEAAHSAYAKSRYTSVDTPVFLSSSSADTKLTSGNASSSLALLENSAFPGAPVLSPPIDTDNAWAMQPTSDAMSGTPKHHRRCSRGSPSGPRIEPAKSVSKIAMELRRMNSEIDTSLCRESRRYLRFDREASPVLPLFNSPNPSESCNSVFDFGFDELRQRDQAQVTPTLTTNVASNDRWREVAGGAIQYGSHRVQLSPMERFNQHKPGTPNSLYDADGFLRM